MRHPFGLILPLIAALLLTVALMLASLLASPFAFAFVHPASVIVPATADLLDVDGAAMAPDGTGGVVYRRQIGGVIHVFAVQFAAGRWGAPAQVDREDPYGALQPTIAAGNGGRLLVVWVQIRNINAHGVALYELMGAALQPGASGFGQAIVIDPNVGEPVTGDISGVDPRLAMAPDGVAYVVYRVITNDCQIGQGDPANGSCPLNGSTGRLLDVRVARYAYLLWSSLGAVNRAPQIAMREPTSANAPAIGIDDLNDNEGLVAWQEPGSDGVARIWVRRLFGVVQGNVLQASPETLGGRSVTSDADSPAVAVSPEGEARIAYRIQGAPGSAVTSSELFVNELPSTVDFHGGLLKGAMSIAGGAVGQPSAAIDVRGDFRVAWTQGSAVQELAGSDETTGSPLQVGSSAGQALTTIDPAGGGATAWPAATSAGSPVVDVREDYAQGGYQLAQLAGNVPGPVSGLSLGGDGQGDALLGWMQGAPGDAEVVGDFTQAPPAPFEVTTPLGWVRGRDASISWTPAPDAASGVTYTVDVDGHPRVSGLTGLATRLDPVALGDGVYQVQVLAVDGAGQRTLSVPSKLKIDANPPTVRIALVDHRRGVLVTIRDRASGVDTGAVRINFGDGHRATKRKNVVHLYARSGAYSVVAFVRDRAGNSATVTLHVRVR